MSGEWRFRLISIALGAAMKKLLATTAIAASVLALGSAAQATFISTDASFFTAPSDGALAFAFEGSDAGDTNEMRLTRWVPFLMCQYLRV